MSKIPHPKRDLIIEDLLNHIPAKVISQARDVAYATVISIKDRCFDTVLKLKKSIPDPRQLTLDFTSRNRDENGRFK